MIYVSDKEIKSYMAKRKREMARISRRFPKFQPGMSVAEYVMKFEELNPTRAIEHQPANVLPYDLRQHMRPAAFLTGPEVIEEALA